MGMLMHHTWLEQQNKKPVDEPKQAEKAEETNEPEAEPIKKTGGRRKNIK